MTISHTLLLFKWLSPLKNNPWCLATMLVSVKEIVESAGLFIWGLLKRSYYLVLALLADPFEFLEIVLGQRIALPSAWLPYLLGTGLLCAARDSGQLVVGLSGMSPSSW